MLKKGLLVGGALLIGLFLLFLFYPFPDESSSVQKDADNSGQEGELSELKEAQSTVLRQISRDSSAVKPDVQLESEPKILTKLPPLRESDEFIRDRVSDWGLPKLWVDNESLIARYAALIASISRGELPRRQLAFLVPTGNFKVLRDGEKIFASPENYRRFDNFVDLVEQVPVGRLAQLLREIDPLVRISLRQLGLSGAPESILLGAFGRILSMPRLPSRIELVQSTVVFEFADPSLESLPEFEKQLIRMGPRNLERLQNYTRKLKSIYLKT